MGKFGYRFATGMKLALAALIAGLPVPALAATAPITAYYPETGVPSGAPSSAVITVPVTASVGGGLRICLWAGAQRDDRCRIYRSGGLERPGSLYGAMHCTLADGRVFAKGCA